MNLAEVLELCKETADFFADRMEYVPLTQGEFNSLLRDRDDTMRYSTIDPIAQNLFGTPVKIVTEEELLELDHPMGGKRTVDILERIARTA